MVDELSDKMGIRGTQTSNLKVDLVVPDSARIGELHRALRLALQTLNVGRIMVSAQSIGAGHRGLREAARRAASGSTFGQPIGENQGIGFMLADMATEISAARMMLYEAARAYDRGDDVSNLGAMAKLFTSRGGAPAATTRCSIGGAATASRTAERLYRDQRILEIYEGSSEIQRLVLGRTVKARGDGTGLRHEHGPAVEALDGPVARARPSDGLRPLAPVAHRHPAPPPPQPPAYCFTLTKQDGEVIYPEDLSAAAEMITTGGHVGPHQQVRPRVEARPDLRRPRRPGEPEVRRWRHGAVGPRDVPGVRTGAPGGRANRTWP